MIAIKEVNLLFKSLSLRPATDFLVVHHTGGRAGDDYSSAELHAMHLGQGWSGIGYHLVIRKDGGVERGRPIWAKGAHSIPGNSNSIGIHLCGNFELETPTEAQIESLAMLCCHLCSVYSLGPYEAIIGHRDQDATACPGQELYRLLPVIRGKAVWYMENESEG
ncbi:MAG: peptidoglycan recognition family protein [Sporomusaceae bacterium]|nr:peptidoglycan recognition family protein [Sporomusaceae bacterium]